MQIHVSSGTGLGSTTLSAFDSALLKAGVGNYNLLRLSSVIPPNSQITVHQQRIRDIPGRWGDRLYVVLAEQRAAIANEEAWAGIGWVQNPTGAGLFVEHESAAEATVRQDITDSLTSLLKNRRLDPADYEIHMEVTGITCKRLPVCALVVAAFQASNWENGAQLFPEA